MRTTAQPQTQPWGTAGPHVPPGVTSRDDRADTFTFVVGKVPGTEDDWATPVTVPLNPRVLAVMSKVPRLKVMSNMYQKYRVRSITLDATPLVSSAGVSGTMLMISEGGSANSPTPPENVNTCKERNGSVCALGERTKFTWIPPSRQYLCRPDGDVSETMPGVVFVSTFLPTTTVLDGQPYRRPLWVISATVQYDFSVFEDPAKNVEDSIISEPLTGKLMLRQDETGAPVLTGDTVEHLTTVQMPHELSAVKIPKNTKNGILLATGILATASAAIPGPLGILLRAGCAIVKLVLVSIPSTGQNAEKTMVPALKIYGSVDDALEDRGLTAPGLTPVEIAADGNVTTLSVGQNPITTSADVVNNMETPQVQKATSPDTFVMVHSFEKDQQVATYTSATSMHDGVNIDNIGKVSLATSGWTMPKLTKAHIVMSNPDGNIWYEGPIVNCPPNATYNGKRCVAWVVKRKTTTNAEWFVIWDVTTADVKIQYKNNTTVTAVTEVLSGVTGTATALWRQSLSAEAVADSS